MHCCRDHFCGSLSESRHLRDSISCPVMKKHGVQWNHGIDGGAEQNSIEFQFFRCGSYLVNCVLLRDHLCGSSSVSRRLRGSMRRPVMRKHGFQCNPGIDGGVKQKHIQFHFLCVVLLNKCFIITAITSVAPEVSPDTFAAASDVLWWKNTDFNVILESTAG